MRALTLTQPWATLVARCGKDVENRTWPPPARLVGHQLAIHAGSGRWDAAGWHSALLMYGGQLPTYDPETYPAGAVVAVATLVDVCTKRSEVDEWDRVGDNFGEPCGCGRWAADGQLHWLLDDVHALAEPARCKGRQGLWTLPAEVESEVRVSTGNGRSNHLATEPSTERTITGTKHLFSARL